MKYLDKNKQQIESGDALLFELEDKMEPTGSHKYVTPVELCFWSNNEQRFIPLRENYENGIIEEAEKIEIQIPKSC